MPIPAFLTLEGSNQGLISAGAYTIDSVGNSYQEGHEDEICVQAVQHTITVPRDPQSGQPTGQRMHKPIVLTKTFDKSSPLIYKALTSGEILTKAVLKWYRMSKSGILEHFFTVKLEDAVIVDIQSYMPNCQNPANADFTNLEDISLSYRKIVWEHVLASTVGEDDWRTPLMSHAGA